MDTCRLSPENQHTMALEILGLIQSELVCQFPSFPEAFGKLKLSAQCEMDASIGTDGIYLYFDPEQVCTRFAEDAGQLKLLYLHTHIHCLCLHPLYSMLSPNKAPETSDLEVDRIMKQLLKDSKSDIFIKIRDSHHFWITAEDSETDQRQLASADQQIHTHMTREQLETLEQIQQIWQPFVLPLNQEIEASASGGKRGHSAGHQTETEDLKEKESIDYHRFLRRFMISREEPILDTESFDYIPYHFGLTQYHNMPFIEPLEYKEVNRLDELAIAIDTSGSCSGNIVRRFLEETWAILRQRENFFSKMRLHILQCDSMIHEHRIITSIEEWEASVQDFRILGHGDTDFCPVFEYLNEQIRKKEIRKLRGLLYFTDGDGIYPRKPPEYDTAFVFLNHELEKNKIPDWGIRLNLNLSDI